MNGPAELSSLHCFVSLAECFALVYMSYGVCQSKL